MNAFVAFVGLALIAAVVFWCCCVAGVREDVARQRAFEEWLEREEDDHGRD